MNKNMKRCVMVPCHIGTGNIMLVGDFPDEGEALSGTLFSGSGGRLLDELLVMAGIERADCALTKVFMERPPNNDPSFFRDKNGTIKAEWDHEWLRLRAEIEEVKPNIIIALGQVALQALVGVQSIAKYRGTVLSCNLVPGVKVLATYAPSYIMMQWHQRPTVFKDLVKARIQSTFPEAIHPGRDLWIDPTIGDLQEFNHLYMQDPELLSIDIETSYPSKMEQILCIGFAPTPHVAIVVPFVDRGVRGWSYWPTLVGETVAWEWCKKWCTLPCPKVGQNFLFDMQWLHHKFGIQVKGCIEDTMLMHHSLEPELEKGLGYLASIYTNEKAFKTMVSFAKTAKKEA